MTIERARIIKGYFPLQPGQAAPNASLATAPTDAMETPRVALGRRVPRAIVDGHEEAACIVAEAEAKARSLVEAAQAAVVQIQRDAARNAREHELARLSAELLAVRAAEERRRDGELDRTIELAVLLAERLVGEGLRVEPERIAALAAEALRETRGARKLRVEASPEDVATLASMLGALGSSVADVEPNAELARGSLVVHTELGRVDARLRPQLERLAEALREALRDALHGPQGNGSAKAASGIEPRGDTRSTGE